MALTQPNASIAAHALIAPRAFAFRMLAAFALAALCALALSSCGHEPEIATPPADYGQEQNKADENTAAQDDADDSSAADDEVSAQDDASAGDDAANAAAQAAHEGPFVVRILNAGGADGLAGAAQQTLAGAGIAGDNYQMSTDS